MKKLFIGVREMGAKEDEREMESEIIFFSNGTRTQIFSWMEKKERKKDLQLCWIKAWTTCSTIASKLKFFNVYWEHFGIFFSFYFSLSEFFFPFSGLTSLEAFSLFIFQFGEFSFFALNISLLYLEQQYFVVVVIMWILMILKILENVERVCSDKQRICRAQATQ